MQLFCNKDGNHTYFASFKKKKKKGRISAQENKLTEFSLFQLVCSGYNDKGLA